MKQAAWGAAKGAAQAMQTSVNVSAGFLGWKGGIRDDGRDGWRCRAYKLRQCAMNKCSTDACVEFQEQIFTPSVLSLSEQSDTIPSDPKAAAAEIAKRAAIGAARVRTESERKREG